MNIKCINNGWKFYRDASSIEELPSSISEAVNLPHTWNNLDGQDGGGDYFRGTCFYEKLVDLNKKDDKDYYLEFRGVNSSAMLYVNGKLVGSHDGGFSTFRFNVTIETTLGINTIVLAVSNSANDVVYPQMADFTFFGGIYRDVYFIEVEKSRFDLDYFGSDGVQVTPTLGDKNIATVTVESFITNAKGGQDLFIEILKDNKSIESKRVSALEPIANFEISHPLLWNGIKNPNIYTAHVVLEEGGKILDERNISFGIRSFSVDKDGFYLNGRKYNLHGVSRHQDRLNKGWAISRQDHDEDMALIKEVGANTIRLAHYQHDQYFYDLCDREGMVVWAEIPYISMHLKNGDDNALNQMRELVIQNYNHPSIMFWGLSNEITIGGEDENLYDLHRRLNDLVHSLDKTRLTTLAAVTMCDTQSPVLKISDIFAYNHYFGWYVGDVSMNASWIDEFRKDFPNTPLAISEYGAEANLDFHSSTPKIGDYSEEYQTFYHERMLKIFSERQYLWATYVWNMFDFAADARDEGGVKGRNNKGLVTYDRKVRKDSFYLYKAYWSDEPFVHICSKRYALREEEVITIKVYTNQPKVDLYVGDKLVESKTGQHVFTFLVKPSLFGSKIRAVAGSLEDKAKFRRVLFPHKDYTLKEEKRGANNWFEVDGVKYEFKYPEDRFSIHDTLNDILADEEGEKLMKKLIGEAFSKSNKSTNNAKSISGIIKLAGGMPVERIAKFAGDKISVEDLYHVNEELNKIEKKNRN